MKNTISLSKLKKEEERDELEKEKKEIERRKKEDFSMLDEVKKL